MDQDIEAILAGTDSGDDLDGNEGGYSSYLDAHGVSLEDILREDDDGSSQGEDDDSTRHALASGFFAPLGSPERRGNSSLTAGGSSFAGGSSAAGDVSAGGLIQAAGTRDVCASSAGGYGSASLAAGAFARGGGSSNALDDFAASQLGTTVESSEDSRLLQQILRESEEDHDAGSAGAYGRSYGRSGSGGSSSGSRIRQRAAGGASGSGGGSEVDLIIESVDYDQEVYSPRTNGSRHYDGDREFAAAEVRRAQQRSPPSRADTAAATAAAGLSGAAATGSASLLMADSTSQNNYTRAQPAITAASPPYHGRRAAAFAGRGGQDGGGTDPLAAAEAREQRLLRSGEAEIISPLQVKRRMRQGQGPAPEALRGGMVRLDDMEVVSAQLVKHASYRQHGPGLPTALAVQAKFLALGTSRGLVLLFDHFQEIRHVLSSAAADGSSSGGPGSGAAPPAGGGGSGAVVSLDVCSASDLLVAGYASGRVALWDFMKGSLLKMVADAHDSPVITARFCHASEPQVVTADTRGVVNKITFKRVMWTAWTSDVECLLDGAAGPMPAASALPWWLAAPRAALSTDTGIDSGEAGVTAGGNGGGAAATYASKSLLEICAGRLLAISSVKSTFVVALAPKVKVVHRWPKPEANAVGEAPSVAAAREKHSAAAENNSVDNSSLDTPPCLAWGWPHRSEPSPGAPVVAVLARGWGTTLQLLAVGSKPAAAATAAAAADAAAGMAIVLEMTAAAAVVALEWLEDATLGYLTAEMDLCVLDTRTATELKRVSLGAGGVVPTLLGYLAAEAAQNGGGGDEGGKAAAQGAVSYHNGFRACQGKLYLLGRERLRTAKVQGWVQRIDGLIAQGEWLEALAVALDHYEEQIRPLELERGPTKDSASLTTGGSGGAPAATAGLRLPGRLAAAAAAALVSGGANVAGAVFVNPGPRNGGNVAVTKPRPEGLEHISDILMRYVRLAIENAPRSTRSSTRSQEPSAGASRPAIDLAHSHFQMLAGVCAEFCVVTGRLDVLFGDVMRRFSAAGQLKVLLDTIEPYILAGKLTYLAPDALRALAERCQARGDMSAFERCLLHLDKAAMDKGAALALCHRHRLQTGLLHVYSVGLGDFLTPLELLLREMMALADQEHSGALQEYGGNSSVYGVTAAAERFGGEGAAAAPVVLHRPPGALFEALGYRALVYLRYCFQGRAFPTGSIPEAQRAAARAVLLYLLVQEELSAPPDASGGAGRSGASGGGARGGSGGKQRGGSILTQSPPLRRHLSGADVTKGANSGDVTGAEQRRHSAGMPYAEPPASAAAAAAAGAVAAAQSGPWSAAPWPYLRILLYLDAERTLESLQVALDSPDAVFSDPGDAGDDRGVGERMLYGPGAASSSGGSAAALIYSEKQQLPERPRRREEHGITAAAAAGLRLRNCPSRRRIVTAVAAILAPRLASEADYSTMSRRVQDFFSGQAAGTVSSSAAPSSSRVAPPPALAEADDLGGSKETAAALPPPVPAARSSSEPSTALPATSSDASAVPVAVLGVSSGVSGHLARLLSDPSCVALTGRGGQRWPAAEEPLLFDFVAKYMEMSLLLVSPALTNAVLVHQCTERAAIAAGGPEAAQSRLVNLLQRVNLRAVERTALLARAEEVGFYRAAVMLLKTAPTDAAAAAAAAPEGCSGVGSGGNGVNNSATAMTPPQQFERVVQCYLRAKDPGFQTQVFGFVHNEVSHAIASWEAAAAAATEANAAAASATIPASRGGGGNSGNGRDPRAVLLSELPALMTLDTRRTVRTIAEIFGADPAPALAALSADPLKQFEYLDCLLRPQGAGATPMDILGATEEGGAAAAAAAGHLGVYMRLLIRFRPHEVYPYLRSHDNYSLDECLALCETAGITDATAYLLERGGDTGGALRLTLQTVRERLVALKVVLRVTNLRQLASEAGGLGSGRNEVPGGRIIGSSAAPSTATPSWSRGGRLTAAEASNGGNRRGLSRLVLERLEEGRELTRSLLAAMELCQRSCPPGSSSSGGASAGLPAAASATSTSGAVPAAAGGEAGSGGGSSGPHGLWFALLDEIIAAKGMRSAPQKSVGGKNNSRDGSGGYGGSGSGSSGVYGALTASGSSSGAGYGGVTSNGGFSSGNGDGGSLMAGELPQLVAVMDGVLDNILSTVLDSMAGYVPLPAIVGKILLDHAGNTLGEFRNILLSMLETYAHETAIYGAAAGLVFEHMSRLAKERHRSDRAGVRVLRLNGENLPLTFRPNGGSSLSFPVAALAAATAASRGGSCIVKVSVDGSAVLERIGGGSVTGETPGESAASAAVTADAAAEEQRQGAAAALWRLKAARRRRQQRTRSVAGMAAEVPHHP